ncbi:helix-turn-helix transcriptional regulator [Microbacterium sp. J1-1]|uniref:helix-turn-helix transcriptional regulator n=1 Tax=Microbacterium sp. J1-1 TaxID=2992441 RepID=UPI0021154654|nr:helix-turn-helix transcriptional regulator [Microbacterium sp. J1-1]UUE19874.1 helix-turn-helix domain-containing protein [Microbacterium sp. J1-1]
MTQNTDRVLAMGRRIAYYRGKAGLSAAELADRVGMGITRSVIANLENGRKADLSVLQLFAIADALDAPVSSIVGAGDRLRAAFGDVSSAQQRYRDSMTAYLDALLHLAIEADRSDSLGAYEELIEDMPSGRTPARLTMDVPISPRLRDYIERYEAEKGKYVSKFLRAIDEDVTRLSAP